MKPETRLIGIRIMQARKEKGLSQEELSEKIGISKNHLSSIERGKYIPTTKLVFELCNVLGGTPDYYLLGNISDTSDEIVSIIRCLPKNEQQVVLKLLKTYIEEINNY